MTMAATIAADSALKRPTASAMRDGAATVSRNGGPRTGGAGAGRKDDDWRKSWLYCSRSFENSEGTLWALYLEHIHEQSI